MCYTVSCVGNQERDLCVIVGGDMTERTLSVNDVNKLNVLRKFLSGRKLTTEEIALLKTKRHSDMLVQKH